MLEHTIIGDALGFLSFDGSTGTTGTSGTYGTTFVVSQNYWHLKIFLISELYSLLFWHDCSQIIFDNGTLVFFISAVGSSYSSLAKTHYVEFILHYSYSEKSFLH